MKKLCLLSCLIIISLRLSAQTPNPVVIGVSEHKLNAVYVELGGPGLPYSFGYERTLLHNNSIDINAAAGIGYLQYKQDFGVHDGTYIWEWNIYSYIESDILFHITHFNYLELGLAFAYWRSNVDFTATGKHVEHLVPRIGFRHNFKKDKMFFKIGFTPFIDISNRPYKNEPQNEDGFYSFPWLGFGVGMRF